MKIRIPEKFKQYYQGEPEVFLPKGFTISVYSAGLINPRFFAWSPSGVLHVASIDKKSVYALPDTNNDGVADTNLIAVNNLDKPHSLSFFKGNMYVADEREVFKLTDNNSDGIFEKREKFIEGIPGGGHFTRTILFDTIQNYVYLSVGSTCDACRETDSLRATILRFKTDGSGRQIFARGLRNAVGLAIEPATRKLWATIAERNNFNGFPEEPITSVEEGSFHGWPFAYGSRKWMDFNDTVYQKILPLTAKDSLDVAAMRIPEVSIGAHTTPLGIHFYTGGLFPAEYKNTAFVAVHGSGSDQTKPAVGYNVIRIRKDGEVWKQADFLDGFILNGMEYDFLARPAGVTSDAVGNLYISSDNAYKSSVHAIYKISFDPALAMESFQNSRLVFKTSALPNIISRGEQSFKISYVLPESGDITITLYDVMGNLLKILHSAHETMGEYLLPVYLPQKTAPGIIFYKVELRNANGFKTVAGKLILE
ncbi:MAG TPA: PQQ-dependent sugar dehydrogenase [Patescibacteria group bacterium]|nr:PQQ-dependent sugar dehydrogenase [Patescibacteria group bacterium]